MRWIFLTLVVMNLVAFAISLVVAPGAESQAPRAKTARDPFRSTPNLTLLNEVGGGEANQLGAARIERTSAGTLSSGRADVVPRDLCEMVGPFESRVVANDFSQRLQAIEIDAALKEIELPVGPGYWVYLEPKSSRQEALRHLAELQAKKIDSYVIPKGELANGISLGMFSRKSLSDARVKEIKSLGLAPKVDEIERSYRELWVMLAKGEGEKMSELSWERVMEGLNILERRQNYCLDVASQENFQ